VPGKSKAKPKAPPPVAAPTISAYRPVRSAEQEDVFMSSILGNMDTAPVTPIASKKKSRKRNYDPDLSPDFNSYRGGPSDKEPPSDPPFEDMQHPSSDDYMSPKKKPRITDAGGMTPAIERFADMDVHSSSDGFDDTSFDDLDMDAFMDVDDDDLDTKPDVKPPTEKKPPKPLPSPAPKKEEPDAKPSWLSVHDSLAVVSEDTLGPLSSSTSANSDTTISALEEDGSLRFFWLDYLENDGKLYFVGKLKDKVTGKWVSCCVTVEGMQRNLFVLQREKQVEQDDEGVMHDTDIVPSESDVYDDFDMIRRELGIKSWRAKWVKRKYAFGETEVPRGESSWMKVVYGFNGELLVSLFVPITDCLSEPQVPMNACSPNILRIFGTNTSAFELFVLKRKIMGPCWLQIKKPQIDYKGVSIS
jgi:DNA polymerase alpha subunit A